MLTFLFFITCFFLGYIAGYIREDYRLMKLLRAQQERGDYWFDKYMREVKEDWEPLSSDFE